MNEGWTQTPNFILDNMANMKQAVFKVCMAVVRQTCGYIDAQGNRKEWDRLSTSRLMQLTGLSNRSVIDAVEKAISDGWIERRPAGQYFEYRLQPVKKVHSFSNETSEESSQVDATYEESSQEPMKKVHTQKKYSKENKNTKAADAVAEQPSAEPEEPKSPPPSIPVQALPLSKQYDLLLEELRTTKNRTAVLHGIYVMCFGEDNTMPSYGYLGKIANQIGGAGYLAQRLWDLSRDRPDGDVLAYILQAHKNKSSNTNGYKQAQGSAVISKVGELER